MDPATPSLTFARSNAPCGHRRCVWSCEGVHVALSPRSAAPAECERPYRLDSALVFARAFWQIVHPAPRATAGRATGPAARMSQPRGSQVDSTAPAAPAGEPPSSPLERIPVDVVCSQDDAALFALADTPTKSRRAAVSTAARADARMPRRRRGSPLRPAGAASMNTSRHPRNLRSPSWTSTRSSTCLSWQRSPSRRTMRRGSTESASARRAG